MIKINERNDSKPYDCFESLYKKALEAEQKNIEAIAISSYSPSTEEVSSRYVNLKYIINEEWIFFSNYQSPKAIDFETHKNISGLFFWQNINTQIRIKAKIIKTNKSFSDQHYKTRTKEKNALAYSSEQSMQIDSFDKVVENFDKVMNSSESIEKRPDFWGGYSFIPYYFEFWEGHKNRLNKRRVFEKDFNIWKEYYVQP
jgi:pyridoxamine 5'-phosphate oxidase